MEASHKLCSFPGCKAPTYVDANGKHHLYCGRLHARQHAAMIYPPLPVINFYHRNEPYYEFTNFYAGAPITINGQWPTTEHYFQGMKFEKEVNQEEVRALATAREAFEYPRARPNLVRASWQMIKNKTMETAVLAKFTQHPNLMVMLIETGNALIVEHTENDNYWGDGGDGSGKNMLGQILMKVRSHILSSLSLPTK